MRPFSSDGTSPCKLDTSDVAISNNYRECRQDTAQTTHNQIESPCRPGNKWRPINVRDRSRSSGHRMVVVAGNVDVAGAEGRSVT